MKFLCAANLSLGREALPPIFTRKLADSAISQKVDGLVVLNLCAPADDHWKLVASKNWKENMDEYSAFQRAAGVVDIYFVLGPSDRWLDRKTYRTVRDGLEAKGIHLLREPSNEIDKVVFAGGRDGLFAPPTDPPAWIARLLRLGWPTLNATQRVGCRRESIAEYALWASRRGFPTTVHGLPDQPTWGRYGDCWLGGPGAPPYALLIDTEWPERTEIVRM